MKNKHMCYKKAYLIYIEIILVAIILFLTESVLYADTISNSYNVAAQIPISGSATYYVNITGTPINAVITNVKARFSYTAYNGVENYVSSRFNRGSDPGTSGGVSLISQGSLSSGNPGTYGYMSFSNWNGQSVNSNYYFRFNCASGSPYAPTIHTIYVLVTYTVPQPPPAPTLYSPSDYAIRYNQTPHSFDWSDVSGADRYRIYIDNNSGFGSPEINSEPTNSQLTSYNSFPNNVYYWKVQARNTAGQWGDWSIPRRFVVDTPPPAPDLSSPANGSQFIEGTTVTFSWSGPDGYSIDRYYLRIVEGTNVDNQPKYHEELISTSRSLTLSGWNPGTHTWAVRAIKNHPSGFNQSTYETTIGWGQYATRTLTVQIPPPSPPSGVTAVYQSSNNWNYITWNAVSGATGYKVYWGTSPGVTKSSNVLPETATTDYGHSGVQAGYCYYYRVSALNTGGESDLSSEVSACVPVPAPDIPQNVNAVQIVNGIRITWNSVSGVGGSTPYQIYWGTDDSVDKNNKSGVLVTDQTAYVHIGLDAGVTYYYRVKACNDSECSELSDLKSAQAPLADLTILLDPIPDNNAQRGTNVQINCTVYRTGGLLRPIDGYVRAFVYMNQDQDPNNISQQDLILGDAGDGSFDFSVMDIDDGSETKPKNVTMPDKDGPFFLHVKVDGPNHWQNETDENNNFASATSTIAIWRPGTPPPEEEMGVLARTWDNSDVYWIKYGKKWPFLDQPTFFNLGYTDAEVQWYGSGVLDGFPLGKEILSDNGRFCYRSQSDSTIFLIEEYESHAFFQWQNFEAQGFSAEDIYWAKPEGLNWIQSIYPEVNAPMIRVEPPNINF